MRRGRAQRVGRPDIPPLTFNELVAACENRFAAPDYQVTRDDAVSTVWVRCSDHGHSVGLQVMQVARLGLVDTLARAEAKLSPRA